MRRYSARRRRWGVLCLFAAALAATLWTVRRPLGDILRTHTALLLSGSTHFATAAQRAAWLEAHPDELRLAMVGNTTATNRRAAFERAIGEINAAGGVKGRRLTTEWIDVKEDGILLQAELMRLAADPSYYAVLTGLKADPLLAMKSILLEGRLITLAPGVTNCRLTPARDRPYIFAPNPSDTDVANGIADWAEASETNRFLFCHGRSEDTCGQAEELQRVSLLRGGRNCPRIPIMESWAWFKTRESILRSRDLCRIGNILLLLEERDVPVDEKLLAWALKEFPGKVVISRHRPIPASVETDRILVPQRATTVEASYRSVYLLADALKKAPSLNPDTVVATLQTAELETPSGPFRFTDDRFEKVERITFSRPEK